MGLSRPTQTQPTSQVIGMKLEKAIVIQDTGSEGHYMFNSASQKCNAQLAKKLATQGF